ncbi:chromate transporter domain-containing protein [Sarocladium implicatum]|nr:chromate transporter domain-containing protein [Sarocladium implicatum]
MEASETFIRYEPVYTDQDSDRSLPGAFGMFGLSLGVSNIEETLPRQAYALLSGLNAATVGIIALAAVQLSEKAITDKLTRSIVFLAASAGMMYTAIWYLPILMLIGGIATIVYDLRWLHGPVAWVRGIFKRRKEPAQADDVERRDDMELQDMSQTASGSQQASGQAGTQQDHSLSKRGPARASSSVTRDGSASMAQETSHGVSEDEARVIPTEIRINMSWKVGLAVVASFLAFFVVIMTLRGVLKLTTQLFQLFANMVLAGTIIFGGGPVVIPLLREYVVAPGWVSSRDFLIGLAIIQAFPGPNFNFAVYLGSLTAINAGYNAAAGAVIAYLGIFLPGLTLVHGTMGIWQAIRGWRAVKSAVRGINAAAVGLIYTAVYRLWQIGYIDEGYREGTSLATEPWWVVVTVTSYVGGMWFGVSPPVAIILGGAMGMMWYGVVTA